MSIHRNLTGGAGLSIACLAALSVGLAISISNAENIDPAGNGSQYAYGENVGWLNAEPTSDGGPGVQVGDSELSGWMWGENIGWISLSCDNTQSCATAEYRVLNDGDGVLSGHAWAENVGWINFGPSTSGVTIDPATGDFGGYAWGENIGWIGFNCADSSSCASANFKVTSGWVCDPPPAIPPKTPTLKLGKSPGGILLTWTLVTEATQYDIIRGDLTILRSSGGNFAAATTLCVDDNRTTTLLPHSPPSGVDFWFLVRATNCGGNGTYDSGGSSQSGTRDGEVLASGQDCQ